MDDKTFGKVLGKTAGNLVTLGVGGLPALLGKVFVEYSIRAVLSDDGREKSKDDRREKKDKGR